MSGVLATGGLLLVATQAHAATITVNTYDDAVVNNGFCSIREALDALNNRVAKDACPAGNGSNDTIRLPSGPAINLTPALGQLNIKRDVTITGDGYNMSYISAQHKGIQFVVGDGTAKPTVTFQRFTYLDSITRALQVMGGSTAKLNYVRIMHVGNTDRLAGAIGVNTGAFLELTHCSVRNTEGFDGVITNNGTTTINKSTFFANDAEHGGVIRNTGTLNIFGSTFAKNTAGAEGAVVFASGGAVLIHSSTIAYNRSNNLESSLCTSGCGALQTSGTGTIRVSGSVVAHNDVKVGPTSSVNCKGAVTSNGYNLLGEAASTKCTPAPAGTDLSPRSANLQTESTGSDWASMNLPKWVGGIHLGYIPESMSSIVGAIPAGNGLCTNLATTSDQRSVQRTRGNAACDIGAIERGTVLFVKNFGGTPAEQAHDDVHSAAFSKLGFTVFADDDDVTATSNADGKSLVFISESVSAATVGTKYRDVAATVIVNEPSLYGLMGMTGPTENTDFGDVVGATSFQLNASALANMMGVVGWQSPGAYDFDRPWNIGFGVPASAAARVATITGSTTRVGYFTYAKGQTMVGRTAAGPRVGTLIQPNSALADDGNFLVHSLLHAASL